MNKKLIVLNSLALLIALPVSVLAFNPGPIPATNASINVNDIIDVIFSILWPIAVAFFIIMFVIAGFMFATAQGDAEKVKTARNFVVYGVVGVIVALLAFSIVFIIRNQLGV